MSFFCNTPIFQMLCTLPCTQIQYPCSKNGIYQTTPNQPTAIFNINNNHKVFTNTVSSRNSSKKSLKKKQKALSLDQGIKKPQNFINQNKMFTKIIHQKINVINDPIRIAQIPRQKVLFSSHTAFHNNPKNICFIQRENHNYLKKQKQIIQPCLGYKVSTNNQYQNLSLKRQPFNRIFMNQSIIPLSPEQDIYYQKKLRTQPSQKETNKPAIQINYKHKFGYDCPKLSTMSNGKYTKQSQSSFTVNKLSKEDQSLSKKIIFSYQKTNHRRILQNTSVRRTQSILDQCLEIEQSKVIPCSEFKLFDQTNKQNCSNSKTVQDVQKLNQSNNQIQIRCMKQLQIKQ